METPPELIMSYACCQQSITIIRVNYFIALFLENITIVGMNLLCRNNFGNNWL